MGFLSLLVVLAVRSLSSFFFSFIIMDADNRHQD